MTRHTSTYTDPVPPFPNQWSSSGQNPFPAPPWHSQSTGVELDDGKGILSVCLLALIPDSGIGNVGKKVTIHGRASSRKIIIIIPSYARKDVAPETNQQQQQQSRNYARNITIGLGSTMGLTKGTN